MKFRKILFAAVFSMAAVLSFAKPTPVEDLYEYTLDNGLTLFVSRNTSVPLVYIEIAVRAGALTQTPETAGLFHLYEHMMFKGNSLYPDAASVNRAMADMGVASWNGTTSVDRVNYYFTVPDYRLREGLEFWSQAIRNPLMNEKELENEKKVVLAEIEGDQNKPGAVYADYINLTMFGDAPWRTDAGGNPVAVRNATVDQLKEIQREFYVPSNSALFVGGNVDPDKVFGLVKEIYGSWENTGSGDSAYTYKKLNENILETSRYACLEYDVFPSSIGSLEVRFRGPDTDFELEDTYAADYLCEILNDPDGIFIKTLVSDPVLKVPDSDYAGGGYLTVRANGAFSFHATVLEPEDSLYRRAVYFENLLKEKILPAIASEKSLYGSGYKKRILARQTQSRIADSQTASGLLSNLSFWWSKVSPDYYYTYSRKISKVSQKDVQAFIKKYFSSPALVTFIVNPQVKPESSPEFEFITKDNSIWWEDERYSPEYTASLFEPKTAVSDRRAKLKPARNKALKGQDGLVIKTATLKNGIPVYLNYRSSGKISAVNVAVRGGVEHLTPETSGLESCLFEVMATSSRNYDSETRKTVSFATGSGISNMAKLSGSALCLNSFDKYLYRMIPVLTDGFLYPEFDDSTMKVMETKIQQSVSSMMNDPVNLLFITVRSELYKGHVYETDSGITPVSAANITKENMEALHKEIISPENIFVVASGNINIKKLVKSLNKTIGKLPCREGERYVSKPVEPLVVTKVPDMVMTHPSAEGTGYCARVFASPANTSRDYAAGIIAADVYSDIMFNVVRERYGACYTPSTFIIGSKAPYGIENLFKMSEFGRYKEYMAVARSYMSSGKVIHGIGEDGEYLFSPLKDRLESYKSAYVNRTYAGNATNAGCAVTLTYNLLQYDDIEYDRKLLKMVQDLTEEKVLSVFDAYWNTENERWFIVK